MPGERFLNARYVHLSQRLTNVDVKSKCPDVFRSLPLFSQKKVLFSETPGILQFVLSTADYYSI